MPTGPDHSTFVEWAVNTVRYISLAGIKKVLWIASPELWSKENNKWIVISSYRTGIITDHAQLERLIWGEEKN